MPGRLAVDFGTSNTVVAVWDENRKEGVPLHIPDFGRSVQQAGEAVSVVPSLIHYGPDQRRWIGAQVLQHNLYQSERTLRWMKRYISRRSPVKIQIDGRAISHFDAGKDFLTSVLLVAAQETGLQDEEIALSAPVEAYEHYEDWLSEAARSANLPRFRLIDEPSAAALGYGSRIQPGSLYLLFDFGGGTVHAAVVLIESVENAVMGQRCRVLGKAGKEIGGASIDQWLFEEVLRQNRRTDVDDDVRRISNSILVECERVKEALSFEEAAELMVMNPDTGGVLAARFTRSAFEELLDQHDLFTDVDRTIRSALNAARERGYQEDQIRSVLMVGGSSQIPSVQRVVRQIFGKERVFHNRPLDAVARGAAAFAAGVDFFDHIQHDYAVRYIDAQKGSYDYRVVVKRGTPYPTPEPVARFTVKAAYDGQTQLGLAIFEMGDASRRAGAEGPLELVFDPAGAVRIMKVLPEEQERRAMFWMNENSPTFLRADPPGQQGEPRFEIQFNIDANKRLLVTSRDLRTNQRLHQDYPVVKLT